MKKLAYLHLLLGCLLYPFVQAFGQKTDSVRLFGMVVYDGFSEDALDKARVAVFEADSVTVLADSLEGIWNESMSNGVKRRYFTGFEGYLPLRKV